MVLFLISFADQIFQPLTTSRDRADGKLLFADKQAPLRIFEECPPPTAWFQTPGPHKDSPFHNNRPDPDHTMRRLFARANAQDFFRLDRRENISIESFFVFIAPSVF